MKQSNTKTSAVKISLTYFTLLVLMMLNSCQLNNNNQQPAHWIDPFIGTDAHGHTYPGATTPFGMVQLSPQTRLDGWDGCSGYHYTDSILYGFAHTALNGTGVSDYGDILIMPVVGTAVFNNSEYSSPFKKSNEKASAGYYSVFLDKPGVLAEMTATTRAGFHRYTFPATEAANFIIDLQHRDHVTDAWIEIVSDTEIRGMRRSSNWAKDMVWYFHAEFSKPFIKSGIAVDDVLLEDAIKAQGTNIKAFVGFETTENEIIEIKLALSAVDSDGAYANLKAELSEKSFNEVRQQAFTDWNAAVGKIQARGGSEAQRKVFYTAMYHAMLQPNTFMDVDRRYRGMDGQIHSATNFTNYTVFSLWDTYRTWHPLMTILEQERSNDFILTMLNMYDKAGLLPIWELAANETYCMIGNHSIPVIVDAWMKGIRGFDGNKALEAMLHSATRDHFGLDVYRKHGYIPGDKEHESISKTLEYAYNDWCIAIMAQDLGREDIYREYIRRAQSWKNIFDPRTGFMRPRLNGCWLTPFDPAVVDWHFTEANAWHYSFYVPQDISGFIRMHGGKQQLAAKIDELFSTETQVGGRDMKDITGLIGQYAQGNEPSHHMAYLYNFVNQPWKTQQRVRQIMDDLYTPYPNGLSGNEDCGQMSAWLIMSAMGFYPVTPGATYYTIGTPWFPEMEILLENGKTFKIIAKGVSKDNIYIQSASLNGKPYQKSYLKHSDLMQGGQLRVVMGSSPSSWASDDDNVPVTGIEEGLILPVPYFEATGTKIKDSLAVSLGVNTSGAKIFYTLDGSMPGLQSALYSNSITLHNTTTITAVAWKEGLGFSHPVVSSYFKPDMSRSIEVFSQWHPNYHSGGSDALIDGLRGAANWRLGGWQGYQGTDFEAIVDLGSVKPITYLGAGFTQDVRSWIWMPTKLTFEISTDGKSFRKALEINNTVASDDYELQQHDIGGKFYSRARYVRLKAKNFGRIPQWHLGAGGDAYIFIDEIIVR